MVKKLFAALALTIAPSAALAQGYVYPNNGYYIHQQQYTPPSNPYQQYNNMLQQGQQRIQNYQMQQQINENTRYRQQQQYNSGFSRY